MSSIDDELGFGGDKSAPVLGVTEAATAPGVSPHGSQRATRVASSPDPAAAGAPTMGSKMAFLPRARQPLCSQDLEDSDSANRVSLIFRNHPAFRMAVIEELPRPYPCNGIGNSLRVP